MPDLRLIASPPVARKQVPPKVLAFAVASDTRVCSSDVLRFRRLLSTVWLGLYW